MPQPEREPEREHARSHRQARACRRLEAALETLCQPTPDNPSGQPRLQSNPDDGAREVSAVVIADDARLDRPRELRWTFIDWDTHQIVYERMSAWEVEGARDLAVLSPSRTARDRVRIRVSGGDQLTPVAFVETLDDTGVRLSTRDRTVRIHKLRA